MLLILSLVLGFKLLETLFRNRLFIHIVRRRQWHPTPVLFCLESPMHGGAWQSIGLWTVGHDWVTSLSLFTFHFCALEKEMATHSSVLAWRIPGTGEPGGLPPMGLHRVEHDWSDLAAAFTYSVNKHKCLNVSPCSVSGNGSTQIRETSYIHNAQTLEKWVCKKIIIVWYYGRESKKERHLF